MGRIKSAPKYAPGEHPNSQANLTYHGGRPQAYGTEKKKRYLTVTDEGWEGVQVIAQNWGCASVSDLLEKLGRGKLKIQP
jgi:hypothetical protein